MTLMAVASTQLAANEKPATNPAATQKADEPSPKSTFETRVEQKRFSGRNAKKDKEHAITEAKFRDQEIAKYIKDHHVSKKGAEALYEGRPTVGMPEEALLLWGFVDPVEETESYRIVKVRPLDQDAATDEQPYYVTLKNDKVSSFRHRQD